MEEMEIKFDIDFWRKDTESFLQRAAKQLLGHGMSEPEAKEFLENIYHAVAEEFGG